MIEYDDFLHVEATLRDGTRTTDFVVDYRVESREATTNGANTWKPWTLDVPAGYAIPLQAENSPYRIEVRVRPRSTKYWAISAIFEYKRGGRFEQVHSGYPYQSASARATEFLPSQCLRRMEGATVRHAITLPVYLSRIKDVTEERLELLRGESSARYGEEFLRTLGAPKQWLLSWDPPPRSVTQIEFAGSDWTNDILPTTRMMLDPSRRKNRILAIAGTDAPTLLSMSWPASLKPTDTATPTPFLIVFRAPFGTNGSFYSSSPNRAWDFTFFSMWQWSFYQFDPLHGTPLPPIDNPPSPTPPHHRMGQPYQVEASGKNVVLLLPMGTYPAPRGDEYVDFLDAEVLREILLELEAHVARQWGVYTFPSTIGRVALSAFSSGNQAIAKFLRSPANAAFCAKELREIYLMDPPATDQRSITPAIESWIKNQPASPAQVDPPRIRLYTQYPDPGSQLRILGAGSKLPEAKRYLISSPDGYRSVAQIPHNVWGATRGRELLGDAHPLFPALFLKDALERSGF